MESSILISTKKVLGVSENYTAFDADIIMHINAAFGLLSQLGIGAVEGFEIEDEDTEWSDFIPQSPILSLVRTYVFLKVRLLFDPPGTSFLLNSMTEQVKEYEWRLSALQEAS